jgi:hypothetical protein
VLAIEGRACKEKRAGKKGGKGRGGRREGRELAPKHKNQTPPMVILKDIH